MPKRIVAQAPPGLTNVITVATSRGGGRLRKKRFGSLAFFHTVPASAYQGQVPETSKVQSNWTCSRVRHGGVGSISCRNGDEPRQPQTRERYLPASSLRTFWITSEA